ncbi:hypothetical protein Hanom_Chr11g01024861 [Helianthus anomalus]
MAPLQSYLEFHTRFLMVEQLIAYLRHIVHALEKDLAHLRRLIFIPPPPPSPPSA